MASEMSSHKAGRQKKVHYILGKSVRDPGAHLYHAATGVVEKNKFGKHKRHKMRKAFARMRGGKGSYDTNLHHWGSDELSRSMPN